MTIHLDAERIRFVELRRRILEAHPDLDDQTLADTLEGATDLKETETDLAGNLTMLLASGLAIGLHRVGTAPRAA